MRRREPEVAVSDEAPAWLWEFRREDWIAPGETFPDEPHMEGWIRTHSTARRRWRAAAEKWCADRGLSFTMTVVGWRRPAPSEAASGRDRGLPRPAGRPGSPPGRGTAPSPVRGRAEVSGGHGQGGAAS